MNNICELEKDFCTGCQACYSKCPTGAIKMEQNEEGFLYPIIDEKKCTNCGLCNKACPSMNPDNSNDKSPVCFAFMAEDSIRKESSTGGVFTVLAEYILKNDGYICASEFDNSGKVVHILTNSFDDLENLRGSKYVQSDINDCFKKIEKIISTKKVLFVGTPCQVAGLKNFLGKNYENLFCVDLICHGVPSPLVFEKYKQEIIPKGEKFIKTNFRDKINGWAPYNISTKTDKNIYSFEASKDYYIKAFLHNLSMRKSCDTCAFRSIPMQGDITIGDFWGVNEYDISLNDNKGTSAILVNNSKGKELLSIIKKDSKLIKEIPLNVVIKGNKHLIYSDRIHSQNRKLFFENIKTKSLKECVEICLDDKCDFLIVNFGWSWFNFGANLTAYAMQELIKSFGFVPKNLLNKERENDEHRYTTFNSFIERYLDFTKELSIYDSSKLAEKVKGVICGSDQVFRLQYIIVRNINKYLLNFVPSKCRKIALSASFGLSKEYFLTDKDVNKSNLKYMRSALQSFDYLSSRELSGKEIYKDIFNLNSDMILDPVFLIDKTKYNCILEKSNICTKNKIVSYILDKNQKIDSLLNYFMRKNNKQMYNLDISKDSVENWLKAIYDCELLITDSFHGACFAIIFNKPFMVIKNNLRGSTRFDTLIKVFDIKENFIDDVDKIYTSNVNFYPNYAKVNRILNNEQKRCINIIKEVLINNYSNNPQSKTNKIKLKQILELKKYKISNLALFMNYMKCKTFSHIMSGKKKEHYIKKTNRLEKELEYSF